MPNTASVSAWKDGFARKELAQDATDTPKIHALGEFSMGIQTDMMNLNPFEWMDDHPPLKRINPTFDCGTYGIQNMSD